MGSLDGVLRDPPERPLFPDRLQKRIDNGQNSGYFLFYIFIIIELSYYGKQGAGMAKKGKGMDRERVVAALKALSNENRLAVFEQIRAGRGRGELDEDNRLSVCGVAGEFDISLSTISHHIKELRAAGLVRCERQGQTIL
jgi:DNA-binding transcriptional ArsR family regulator